MLSLRQKLSLGFGALLTIMVLVGMQSVSLLSQLGDSIDVILRENYRSTIACQQMREALENINSGILFRLLGYEQEGIKQISANEPKFENALQVELNNVTLPGEGEKARRLQKLFTQYKSKIQDATNANLTVDARLGNYSTELLPLFEEINTTAENILQMNQENMWRANDRARHRAASAKRQMYFLLAIGAVMAGGFIFFTGRWILKPITRLIESANDIKAGNLDLVVKTDSRDEIGQLSEAFNSMAESLRQVRRTREARLAQIQYSVQQAFHSLPDAVAVVDRNGRVQVATEIAASAFGLRRNTDIRSLSLDWLMTLFNKALKNGVPVEPNGNQPPIQHFINGDERYFWPKAVPILDREKIAMAVMIVLSDITQQRQQEDLKRGVISTVSHQLKTPLTSVRMAIHLLLEEDLGGLTEKQSEVLIAAEEDAERLHRILEDLLDIGRIEAGKAHMDFRTVSTHDMALDAVEPFRSGCQDCGVSLNMELPDDLPEIWADQTRVTHVFANLFSNALKYTDPGGKITLSAKADEKYVYFSVSDTGKGIPECYLQTIFEQFFRIPDQDTQSGVGLGLAIAKEIVEAHGGSITAESRQAKGSTFTFSLKRADHIFEEEALNES
ncbi:MAG: ATP-binding protein [Desulfomonilaceae bacterium]